MHFISDNLSVRYQFLKVVYQASIFHIAMLFQSFFRLHSWLTYGDSSFHHLTILSLISIVFNSLFHIVSIISFYLLHPAHYLRRISYRWLLQVGPIPCSVYCAYNLRYHCRSSLLSHIYSNGINFQSGSLRTCNQTGIQNLPIILISSCPYSLLGLRTSTSYIYTILSNGLYRALLTWHYISLNTLTLNSSYPESVLSIKIHKSGLEHSHPCFHDQHIREELPWNVFTE